MFNPAKDQPKKNEFFNRLMGYDPPSDDSVVIAVSVEK